MSSPRLRSSADRKRELRYRFIGPARGNVAGRELRKAPPAAAACRLVSRHTTADNDRGVRPRASLSTVHLMRLRRLARCWPALVVLGVVLVAYALWPARFTYTVSPETTYVTDAVDVHGVPDYVAALNDRLGKDVTPETNANVLIWRALGPHPE